MISYIKIRKMNMNRKLQLIILFLASFALLLLGSRIQIRATDAAQNVPAYNTALEDPYKESILGSRDFSNLIVSVSADHDALYGEEDGLLTKYYMHQGREGEREIQIFVYDSDGTPLIAQGAGIRISGAASRSAVRKSFRIIAREEYDKSFPKFTYDLWGGRRTVDGTQKEIREYSSFILHAVRLSMDCTGIHNSVGYSLARKAGIVDASFTTPAAVYINGVYQGAYFIMPAKTDNALAELYNIADKDDIEFTSVFEEEKTKVQTNPEVLDEYLDFVNFVQTSDLNDPEVIAEVERQLDVDQCLKYYAVNLLLGNGDWLDNNLRVWRCKNNGLPYQDGRWRLFLFDLDWIGSFPDLVSMNFQQATQSNDYYNLLPSLLKNPNYLKRFRDIIAQMEQDSFNEETIKAVFSHEEARMQAEAAYDFQSEAFAGYHLYSINSSPVEKDEWLTLEDRELLIQDFETHLLKTPEIINECMETCFPDR